LSAAADGRAWKKSAARRTTTTVRRMWADGETDYQNHPCEGW
jgi:hypothetical protein